jgi:lipoprotein-releasing system permease protein
MPEVDVVSPMASGPALISRGAASSSVSLIGIEPDRYYRIVSLPTDMVAGVSTISGNDMLIGKDLADTLGVKVGDKLPVETAIGGSANLTIRGIYDLGNKGVNQRNVYVSLSTAQGLLNMIGGISSIDLTLRDPYAADVVANLIAGSVNVEADSWIQTNAQFFTAIRSQNISSAVIRISVAISVALGIASVLVVSVVQRSKEIGILRAMGASQGQMMRVFLAQGGIVGMIGSIFGSALARAILALWLALARNPDGTALFAIEIPGSLYVLATLLATVSGVVAAMVPALRASRLDPVEAIRG